MRNRLLLLAVILVFSALGAAGQTFVTAKGGKLYADGKEYRFVGTNYWYGSLLGLEKDKKRGIERLRKELDLLKKNGVTNLRLMAGAEGTGPLNGIERVGPPLQAINGRFNPDVLDGLDIVLDEMAKRRMKAVIFLSNNWEWSGGFQQYLIWNGIVNRKWLTQKPTWDELRDIVAKFYSCRDCIEGYDRQMRFVLGRTNKITGKKYIEDPTIMAWEVANEPRPMRPAANDAYSKWLAATTAAIKALDKVHLVTLGHEGWIGTEDIKLFETVHADPNVDYLTIHIWPKNWGWFENGKMAAGFAGALEKTEKYIDDNAAVAVKLSKPLVIEEFGLPRDGQSFDVSSTTKLRDQYYEKILSRIGKQNISGANFWVFGGTARPVTGQLFWKVGDDRMGDPPMEEQGLNSVFDSDKSTWMAIKAAQKRLPK
ncbi:MAG: cellulase family glycosylhydrolase [Acidobacteria bacterium]|nr:cellulase family glycosylhydrolase [Acidobacteriota bacterium]